MEKGGPTPTDPTTVSRSPTLCRRATPRRSAAPPPGGGGAGTGFYLAHALERCPEAEGLASDVSVPAAKRAARAHPRAASIVADTWAGLPLIDGVADAIICVFAPRNPTDFARVLRPGGGLIVAQPAPEHLGRLRSTHGLLAVGEDKAERLGAAFPGWETAGTTRVRRTASLTADEVRDLIAMGPNAFHRVPAEIAATEVEIAVDVVHLVRPVP
ncbi:hypothetical protein G7085_02310 [Tessaracoccus sp. HDW20]|uniref:methyltransferase domain-containing protein n=1 Tax=Tessaracoccus coleopterorum TaxID=2714950 RepID=UPI0018D4B1EC|nr:methyltransferase domain-containing protein [Tessaracoccus coleopterorum]NHB83900.1 hypothetical protein [Tessaracoccus coleopterorum]